ncbi:MAG: D-sedoheptulose 7-phosphate isomerase [Bacteroidales bacterium]|nr:D-sedoheptulose 7-phosphate isomerase [Bacteroidales bacterium]
MENRIREAIEESISLKKQILEHPSLLRTVEKVAESITECFRNGGKVLFCGNGGSAADAQHLAAEFSGRFYFDRPPLFAEALHVNTSYLTAVGNDYGYDEVFARLVSAKGRKGDVLVALSTSGNSPNILKAAETAGKLGMITVGITGSSGGRLAPLCSWLINVPSDDTPRIQEAHILVGHIICELVEKELFG